MTRQEMGAAAEARPPDADQVRQAASRLGRAVRRTPVEHSGAIDAMAGRALLFKCENLQRVGAFKFRGAMNAVMKLPDDLAARGVVTHSSGNHAQALALAARLRGIEAHVVMPRTALAVKRAAVEGYGAHVYTCEPGDAARTAATDEVIARTGGTLIPPFDHPDVIAGQGTAALELLEQAGELDAIIAPVGGGGLLAGTALAVAAVAPDVLVIGAEPAGADDSARSLAAGKRLPANDPPDTICDGLLTGVGALTWPVIQQRVAEIITVDDEQTIAAMRLVWQRMKLIIEPSAAVAVAAALALGERPLRRVGVILSGGNVDLDRLPWAPRPGGPHMDK